MSLVRCTRCVYPDTRPDANFVDGICSACRAYDERKSIDWEIRAEALRAILAAAKRARAPWDAVVPVSGGKDSTYQVIRLKELGAKVLAVNGGTEMLSEIGRRNLDNLKRFCDVIEVTPCTETRKKLVRIGTERVFDSSWSEHNTIWAAPTRMAVALGIPYVVWGEQPQREYQAPEGIEPATQLDAAWVAQFGGMLGLRLDDLVGEHGISAADLEIYRFPSDAELNKAGVKGIWLGDYEDWDGWRNAFIAQQYGFETLPFSVEQSLANYENLDNHVTVLRDWQRFLKFGYARATDIACNHIRRGRLSREQGLHLIAIAERFPWTSLGKPIAEVLDYFGISVETYIHECDKHTNTGIFQADRGIDEKHADGTPKFRKPNGLGAAHHSGAAL